LGAILSPAVPTAAIAFASCRCASSTMPAIASAVRVIAGSVSSPVSSSPSPSRVTSARSTTVCDAPSALRSARWNLTELVPTSITPNTSAPIPNIVFKPLATQTLRRSCNPSLSTVALTNAVSGDSAAAVRDGAPSAVISVSSTMHSSIT
jgi:hypothetical protein